MDFVFIKRGVFNERIDAVEVGDGCIVRTVLFSSSGEVISMSVCFVPGVFIRHDGEDRILESKILS